MRMATFVSLLFTSAIVLTPALGDTLDEQEYPMVSKWLEDNSVVLQGSWDKAYLEVALLHNIRAQCIHNGIPASSYKAMLDDTLLPVLKEDAGQARGAALNATRNYLLGSIFFRGPARNTPFDDSEYVSVSKWITDNELNVADAWEKAYMELAVLYNLRMVCIINGVSPKEYEAMLDDVALPILKNAPGPARGAAINTARMYLLRSGTGSGSQPSGPRPGGGIGLGL